MKRSNILITKDGKIKVADFGIAVATPVLATTSAQKDSEYTSLLDTISYEEIKNFVVSLENSPAGVSPYWSKSFLIIWNRSTNNYVI